MTEKKAFKRSMMKRIVSLLAGAALMAGTVGCGGTAESQTAPPVESKAESSALAEPEPTSAESEAQEESEKVLSVDEMLENMTLEEKIGQMIVPSFRIWKDVQPETEEKKTVENVEQEVPAVNVTEVDDKISESIAKYHFGGVALFAENIKDPEQTVKFVAGLQAVSVESGGLPLIISTDQEGGFVSRLTYGTSGPGNMALTATGDPENAKTIGSIFGEELSLLGINTDYAPVMDVNNNPNNPVIGVRSFSDEPETVSTYGLALMEGLAETGTIVTLKHFPGHGDTGTDSHTGFPCIESSYEDLQKCELVPFQKAIDAGAEMIMTAHIQYPNIETETYTSTSTGEQVYLPATLSHTILTDILRKDMGFEGVIVTDALDMAAITENFSKEDMICMAINAGANMLLLPTMTNTQIFHDNEALVDLAIQLAKDGKINMDCIDDSVRRILTLKEKHGLWTGKDFTVTDEQVNAAVNGVGSKENRETAWKIAEKALTVLKNEDNAFPINMQAGEKALVIFADSAASRFAAGELAGQILTENNMIPEGAECSVMVNTAENEEECVKAALEADYVVLVHRMYTADNLDPNSDNGFSSGVFDRIISERHAAGRKVVLISCHLPYDAVRFPDADAVLLTYGASMMKVVPPAEGEGSAYMPNLPAALCACFGMGEPGGQLPVKLPEIDENYKIVK